jgi:hypothetical protein
MECFDENEINRKTIRTNLFLLFFNLKYYFLIENKNKKNTPTHARTNERP